MSRSNLATRERDWGRAERRVPVEIAVEIHRWGDLSSTEKTLTRNVSTRGACILTKQRWEPNERILLTAHGARRTDPCRVVYCERFASDHNAIGIAFQTPFGLT